MKILISESQLSRLVNEQISGVPLLRKLAYKSKLNFGKFKDLTVQDLINLGRKSYLRYIYYNLNGISFIDDVLRDIKIIGDGYDYTIQKPGINPDLGNEINQKFFRSFSPDVKEKIEKRMSGERIGNLIQKRSFDDKKYSKGNLQRINHGH